MAKGNGKITVPETVQGRSFTGPGSLEDIVLYILESAIKTMGETAKVVVP